MVQNESDSEDSNAHITDQLSDEADPDRRSFMKLVGSTAAAVGLSTSAAGVGSAASGDPFDYVRNVTLQGGYPRTVSEGDATTVVSSSDEFIDAVGSASSGDVIYLPGDAQIDLSGQGDVSVPGGVTIASDRGVNGSDGGMIFTDVKELPLLRTDGEGVRLTGIRLRGNHPEGYHEFTEWNESASGFQADHAGAEVDNCEVFGWGYAGISAKADGLHVHHCNIHANEEDGLGYGVHCLAGHTTIEFNYFLHNRHAIAGGGSEPGYTARYNLVGPEADDHAFDMHEPGGNRIDIHHNKFEYSETMHGSPIEAVKIRGVPQDSCTITDNCFHHDSKPGDSPVSEDGEAINQSGSDGEWQNLSFSSNYYGPDAAPDYGASLLKEKDPFTGSATVSTDSNNSTQSTSPKTLEIRTAANAGEMTYEFTADGSVVQAADDVENNDTVTDNGDGTWTVSGSTGNGYADVYEVSGEVVSFSASPADVVTVVFDGTDITEDLLNGSNGPATLQIHTTANSGRVNYEFTADGSVAQAADDVERNDTVTDNGDGTWTVTGSTGNGYADVYEVSGEVVTFSATPADAVTVYLDGTDVTDSLGTATDGVEMTKAIRFDASGTSTESTYSFEASKAIEPGPDNSLENADVVSGTTAEGTLTDDIDVYHYAGDLVSFDFDGSITVTVDDLS